MAETRLRARLRAPAPDYGTIVDGAAGEVTLASALPVLNLRKCWELASVLNFWHVFRPVIQSGMEVSAEEIEEALIAPNETLTKLHIAFLKGIPPVSKNLKDPDRWVPELSKKLAPWWPWVSEGVYPFVTADKAELTKYKDFDPKTRLLILKALCEIRALQDDVLWYIDDALKHGAQLSNFQKNRIGGNQNGTSFWYDGDSVVGYRLYKEINQVQYSQKIKDQGRLAAYSSCQWKTLATNLEEFLDISDKLASSKIRVEAAVGHAIKNEVIPVLQEEQKKKERKLKRQRREQILLGAFHNSVRIDRPRRGCRPVSYTFDEYDRSINEAIKTSTKGWTISEVKDESKHGNNNLGGENIVPNGRRAQMVPTNGMASSDDDDEYQGTRRQGCHEDIDEDYNDHALDNISEESNSSLKAEENGFKRNTRRSAAIQRNHQVQQQGLWCSARTAVCSTSENDKASIMGSTTIVETKKRLRQRPTLNSDMVLNADSGIESEIVDNSLDEGPEMVSDSEES